MLTGATLRLRPLSAADVPAVQQWLNDAEIVPFARPVTLAYAQARVAASQTPDERRIVFTVESLDGEYVGETRLFGMDPENRHAEWGLVIADRARWGRGIGKEAAHLMLRYAFGTLKLHQVTARVRDDNPRALALSRALHFRTEARLRARFFRHGHYVDCHEMSLLREEWEAKERAALAAAPE